MSNKAIPPGLVEFIRSDMPDEYKYFFRRVYRKHDGKLNVCYVFDEDDLARFRKHEPGVTLKQLNCIPHPVHAREGMIIRNAMRKSGLCKDWDAHDYDDNWIRVVILALELKKE